MLSFLSLPWSQATYWGYFGEIFFLTICPITFSINNGAVLLFFISKCMYHHAFFKMFNHLIEDLNQSSIDPRFKSMQDINQSAETILRDAIQFRAAVQV